MKKILIIEDDLSFQKLLSVYLKSQGYQVTNAYNGEEGLSKAVREMPDLILLDMLLPKMNGADLLKKLRENETGKNLKVIVLSNLEKVPDIHVSSYLVKSNTKLSELSEKIKEII